MTLREALKLVDRDKVYKYIFDKDTKGEPIGKLPTIEQVKNNYSKVINELLLLKHNTPYKMSWYIHYQKDWYADYCKTKGKKYTGEKKYVDVCFLNHNYEKPQKGLKPWGGDGK